MRLNVGAMVAFLLASVSTGASGDLFGLDVRTLGLCAAPVPTAFFDVADFLLIKLYDGYAVYEFLVAILQFVFDDYHS